VRPMPGGKSQQRSWRSSGSTTTLSAIDAVGNRVATGSGGAVGFLLPDLHGNTAGALNSTCTAITDAFAYDAYGNTVASVTSALPTPWRYQGRILESAPGTPDLYDFGARSYNPTIGTFTSLDSTHGSAQNPALLNGYLYANANPATLVDPDGHCAIAPSNRDEAMWCAAHADTTYGQAGPTGRTPADDVVNASRSTRTAEPYGPPAPSQKLTLGNGIGLMKGQDPHCDNIVCGLQNNVGGAVDSTGRAAIGKVSDLAGGVGNGWADTGGAAVNYAIKHPLEALALAGGVTLCAAIWEVCLAGMAGYSATTAVTNAPGALTEGKPLFAGWNPVDALMAGDGSVLLGPFSGGGNVMNPVAGFIVGAVTDAVGQRIKDPDGSPNRFESVCQGMAGSGSTQFPSGWTGFAYGVFTGVVANSTCGAVSR
jgi:RHS repeat-associated protein